MIKNKLKRKTNHGKKTTNTDYGHYEKVAGGIWAVWHKEHKKASLKNGVWLALFYGSKQEYKIKYVSMQNEFD